IVRQLYMSWKMLRLPWRNDILAGSDLDGNLYFERFVRGAYRARRRVVYSKNLSVSDYKDDIIPVQWQAWMRHTRDEPPTTNELLMDIQRRRKLEETVQRLAEKEVAARLSRVEQEKSETVGSIQNQNSKQPALQKAAPGENFQPEEW
ncbi:hypothetical protein BX070DRAFT_178909, partial [Coemansia spiralis]